jgi:F-type H+-transporting ATPase subunit delta
MQENITIARPYAQAAFEEARQGKKLQEWSDVLSFLGAVVADPGMRKIIQDPRVGRERLRELISDICGERLFKEGQNFVRLLIEAGRIQHAPEIAQIYEALRAEAEGVVDVDVVSAYPLEQGQEKLIVKAVQQRTGKDVKVTSRIDQSLIGGVVVRIGDLVIDTSLRGRLKQLANQFA